MKLRVNLIICAFYLQFITTACVTHYCENGNELTITGESTGVIRTVVSGNSHYGNNLNCRWKIDGGFRRKIQLTISSSDLQYAPSYTSCGGHDHLSIMNGDSTSSKEITSICGEKNPYEIITSGQYAYLKFYSNDKNFYDHTGVTLTFTVFNDNECPPGWTQLNTTDTCYRIKQSPSSGINWFEAYQNCQYSQSNLAIVNQHQIFDRLIAYGQSLSVSQGWIGLTDIETEDTLKWLNNENLYSWIQTQGNSDDHDCAILDIDNQKFVLRECKNDDHLFVCERNRENKTEIYPIPQEKKDTTEPDKLNARVIFIIVGIVIAVIVLSVIIWCKIRRKSQYKRAHQSLEMDNIQEAVITPQPQPQPQPSTSINREDHFSDKTPLPEGSVYPSAPPSYEHAVSGNV